MRHKWIAVGGMKENPGTWDTGNGALIYVKRCAHCGLVKRYSYTYAMRHLGPGCDWGPHYYIGSHTGPWAQDGDSRKVKFQPCHRETA